MHFEKVFVREDKTKVKVDVRLHLDYSGEYWTYSVAYLPPRKKNWIYPHSTNDYLWRRLDANGRKEYEMNIYLQYATKEEILETAKELISKIELPKLD